MDNVESQYSSFVRRTLMGKVIGTCGHEIDYEWGHDSRSTFGTKDHDRTGKRVVKIITACRDCRAWYVKKRLVLRTTKQYDMWIHGKT